MRQMNILLTTLGTLSIGLTLYLHEAEIISMVVCVMILGMIALAVVLSRFLALPYRSRSRV